MRYLIISCVVILPCTVSSMELEPEKPGITNRLQLLPLDANRLIARYIAQDFLTKNQPEFEKRILCENNLASPAEKGVLSEVVFHPREKQIAIIQQQPLSFDITLFDTKKTEKTIHPISHIIHCSEAPIHTIRFNEDGTQFGFATKNSTTVSIFDGKKRNKIYALRCSGRACNRNATFSFNPHNKLVTYIHAPFIGEWNGPGTKAQHSATFLDNVPDIEEPRCIAYNADPEYVITIYNKQVVSLNIAAQQYLPIFPFTEELTALVADKDIIACTSRNTLIIHHKEATVRDTSMDNSYICAAIHPHSPLIALLSADGTVHLYDIANRTFIDTQHRTPQEIITQEIFSQTKIAFSPCGSMLGIAFQNQYELWYFTTASKDWLRTYMQIPLAALICRMQTAQEEYKLVEGSEDHEIFYDTEIPNYVQDFLRHYLKKLGL